MIVFIEYLTKCFASISVQILSSLLDKIFMMIQIMGLYMKKSRISLKLPTSVIVFVFEHVMCLEIMSYSGSLFNDLPRFQHVQPSDED